MISWTARPDIARFLAYVVTELPPSKLEWAIFRIEGERAVSILTAKALSYLLSCLMPSFVTTQSFNQIFAAYEKKTGKKIDVTYRSAQELQDTIANNPHDFASRLHLSWSVGQGQVGKPEQVSNGGYPEWNPKNVLAVLAP